MEIYISRGPKQTWHQNEATPRESKRNAPTGKQIRLFASNIKELQQERVRASSCGWTGEGGTLQKLCSPQLSPMRTHEGSWGGGGSKDGQEILDVDISLASLFVILFIFG